MPDSERVVRRVEAQRRGLIQPRKFQEDFIEAMAFRPGFKGK